MEARSRWLSIINERTIADFKRVADQTGILTKEPDHRPKECSQGNRVKKFMLR